MKFHDFFQVLTELLRESWEFGTGSGEFQRAHGAVEGLIIEYDSIGTHIKSSFFMKLKSSYSPRICYFQLEAHNKISEGSAPIFFEILLECFLISGLKL